MSILITVIGLLIPFIGTTLGSALVYFFKDKGISPNLEKVFNGFAAGVMFSTSVFGLILPATEYKTDYMPNILVVVIGFALGIGLLLLIDHLVDHIHSQGNYEEGIKVNSLNKTQKMFLAVLIHNIPEGLSTGVIFGVALAGLTGNEVDIWTAMSPALILSVGMAIQNIPEGTVVSLPFKEELNSTNKAFGYGVATGAVEPIFAILGVVATYFIELLMPWALSFAAGCMIYVTIEDLVPTAIGTNQKNHFGLMAFLIGFVLMMVLDFTLG